MKIEISGKIKKPDNIQPCDMVCERVYQFGSILAVETSMGEVIAADTDLPLATLTIFILLLVAAMLQVLIISVTLILKPTSKRAI